jgi:hypothetical protein
MAVDLPIVQHETARSLATWCTAEQLARAIAYLELVYNKKFHPGREIERLFGDDSLLVWTMDEVDALQKRLGLALCIKRGFKDYPITRMIKESVQRNCNEVLNSYNAR